MDMSSDITKRKRDGVYYTPEYITDYICRNTIIPYLSKSDKITIPELVAEYSKDITILEDKVKKITVCDPACGVGVFLIKTADILLEIHHAIWGYQKRSQDRWDAKSEMCEIIQNNIYGVDIDAQAVKTACRVLSSKTSNIKVGNSLISDKSLSNSFSWKDKFPDIFDSKNPGFSVIVGNPPYFSLQTISDMQYKENLKKEFPKIYTGHNDILYFFYALGTRILKQTGHLGFITSRYLLEAEFAKGLRTYLIENTEITQIIDFGSNIRLFHDANINTCIIIYKNIKNQKQDNVVNVIKVKDWTEDNQSLFSLIKSNSKKSIKNKQIEIFQKTQREISDHRWTLQSSEMISLVNHLKKDSKYLGDFDNQEGVCRIFQGFTSGMDTKKDSKGNIEEVFRVGIETIQSKNLESGILKPMIKIGMIRRYVINSKNEYLIFTTDETNIDDFPNIKKHLMKFKDDLVKRHDIVNSGSDWYRIANLRNHKLQLSKEDKLYVPMIAPENRFVFVSSDSYVCSGDVYVVMLQDDNFDLRYIQGILNSKLMNLLVKRNAKAVDGSARTANGESKRRYSYSVKNISNLPIKKATEPEQKEISNLVKKIQSLHDTLAKLQNKNVDDISTQIQEIDKKIDDAVFRIYGVNPTKIEEILS